MQKWIIKPDPNDNRKGRITGALVSAPCALGRSGMVRGFDKCEGDGATPMGSYPVRQVFYRSDKINKPVCRLPLEVITPSMGWCDASEHPAYNKLVQLPFGNSHELLWRDDDLYDLIVVIGHNDDPVVAGAGSCIFLHITRGDYEPTEGCASFIEEDLLKLVRLFSVGDQVVFTPED